MSYVFEKWKTDEADLADKFKSEISNLRFQIVNKNLY